MINKIETTLTIRDKQYQVNWDLKQVNILVGDNGSGKSRLLNFINSQNDYTLLLEIKEPNPNPMNNDYYGILSVSPVRFIEIASWYKELTGKQIYLGFSFAEYIQLSKGEKYLLDLLDSIHIRTLNSIVLIDDIEQNLYITTQRKLLPFLIEQRPDLQFIVTTHSPCIVNRHYEWQTMIDDILTEI